jgi:ppGpp synthetase/RelA/SpoT-type nucleotidyltranferase
MLNTYEAIEKEFLTLKDEENAIWENFRYNTWASGKPEDFYDKGRVEYLRKILDKLNRNVNLISEFEFDNFIMDEFGVSVVAGEAKKTFQ